jgi:preprotein translocase subunit SecD
MRAIVVSLLVLAGCGTPHTVVRVELRPVVVCGSSNSGEPTRLKGSAEPIYLGADLWANQDNVQSARVERDLEGKPMVILVLKEQSAARVRDLTSKNIGKSVGILINGELVVAPQIHAAATEIPIQGVYSPAQAQDLAAALNRQARS